MENLIEDLEAKLFVKQFKNFDDVSFEIDNLKSYTKEIRSLLNNSIKYSDEQSECINNLIDENEKLKNELIELTEKFNLIVRFLDEVQNKFDNDVEKRLKILEKKENI